VILVVGSSGLLGGEVAKRLLDQGQPVRALARTPAKVEDLRQLGAEVVQGDLIDPPSLAQACRGATCVFSAAHSMVGKGRYKSEAVDGAGQRNLIDAAKAAGVSRFVYTSILGAAPDHPVDFWRTKYQAEEHLRASTLTYTILRPSAFMETHAHVFNGKSILERGKTTQLGAGTKYRNFVALRDVARIAILAVTDPRLADRIVEVGGPQDFTNNQVAALYGRLAGLMPKVRHMPSPIARGMSIVLKPFQPGVSRVMYLGSLPDDAFSERYDATALLAEFPMQLTTLEGFVRERVAEAGRSSAA
jgi:NADH dehydrogenase